MNITIDGKNCECQKGEFLRDIAIRNGIHIPSLCHHEGLPEQGCCRVCIVEVLERGSSKIVVSCVYPVSMECEVRTNSEKVCRQRGITLMLLKKRAPESKTVASMCAALGAPEMPRLKDLETGGKCVLCGLCARACAELGAGAISTVNRGISKEIATPYHEPSAACIGCGSCANICPTKAIDIVETEKSRTIWERTFEYAYCLECGTVLGTNEEIEFAAKKAGNEKPCLCHDCRQKHIAGAFAHTYGI